MPVLSWDGSGERFYETGVSKCVLYTKTGDEGAYATGVPWNGITAINENPSGAEATPLYADNIKYLNLVSAEEFGLSIEAYMYPDEFAVCDGSVNVANGAIIHQQPRKQFGLCYRTEVGDDLAGTGTDYKIHIVWNCLASPSGKGYITMSDSPEAITISWDVTTTPEPWTSTANKALYAPVCLMEIDSRVASATGLAALEELLYGGTGDSATAQLPTPDEVLTALNTTPQTGGGGTP